MTRQEMIDRYAEIQCCTLEQAADRIDAFTTVLIEGLEEDGKVWVKWLGTFKVGKYKAHTAYDFKMKKSIIIPEHNTVKFSPAIQWKKELSRKIIKSNRSV